MRYFIILFFFTISQHLTAQLNLFDIQYPYTEFAYYVYEDNDGSIWLYDNETILRYNGEKFTTQNSYQHKAVAYNTIHDSTGIVYLKQDRVYHYHRKTKTTTQIGTLNKDTTLDFFYRDDADRVWIFTKNIEKKERNVYKITETNTLEFAFNLYHHLGDKSIDDNIELEDFNGNFYVHLWHGRLLIIDSKGTEVKLPLEALENQSIQKPCSVFRLDNKNNLWRITYDVFEIYNPEIKRFEIHPISNKIIVENECQKIPGVNLSLTKIFMDSDDRIWLGFEDSNLFMYDEKENTFINFKTPLIEALGGKGGDIKSLMEDQNGNIWGNKRGGIFKIRKKENGFRSYLVNTTDPEHELYKLNPTYTKTLWFYFGKEYLPTAPVTPQVTSNGDIYAQDQRFSYRILAKNDSLEVIPWLHSSQKQYLHSIKDSLRIYTTWSHYYSIDKNLKTKIIPNPVGFPLRSLSQVFQTKDGIIWASGSLHQQGSFLAQLHPKTLRLENVFKKEDNTEDFSDNFIVKLDEDDQGNLLISSYNGLYKMNLKSKVTKTPDYKFYKKDSIRFDERITKFDYTGNDLGWIFNRNQIGLLNLKENRLIHYITKDQLNLIEINDVLPVNNHTIWYSCRTGIGLYNFKTNENKHFDKTYTLIDNFFAKQLKSNPYNGELIVTSTNGLHRFHPDSLLKLYDTKKIGNENVNLTLTDYSVLPNKSKSVNTFYPTDYKGETIALNYNDKSVTFNFELIHYSYPSRHRYTYKLEGYDNEWSQLTSKSEITYMSLPPGDYTLNIKGSTGGHTWSKNELSIPIYVKQAWYRTWWFFILVGLLLALLIYALTRYYYQLKFKQKTEIDNIRTKISIDLHDDVGSILTGLSMQSEILEQKATKEDKAKLHRMSELSRSAMLRMRDAVWAMDSRKNNWESLIDRMNEFAAETLELKSIEYYIKHHNITLDKSITNIMRQNLYLIYKEAVTNIIKHSDANYVAIELNEHHGQVELLIKDNGSIKPKFSTSGLGLSNMKHRADQINCNLEIKKEQGFTIHLKSKSLT